MLLGVWMRIFGSGEADTHALSVGIATLIIPVAFLSGRALFGTRAGWLAAFFAALNPFLTYYAQETRMYALVVLLSMVMLATFVLGFVHRRRSWLPLFALSLALLVYTHNYGLFLGMGTVAALAVVGPLGDHRDRRALLRDAALCYGAVGLVYLPWVPTLLFQARHTGAPWSNPPSPSTALAGLTALLSGASAATGFALAGGSGLGGLLSRTRLRGPEARGALALLVTGVVAFVVAWTMSQISPAWALRYLSVFVAPLLLLGAAGIARAGTLGIVVLVGLAVLWFNPRTGKLNSKSNAHTAAVLVRDRLGPGDLVVATHPEQGPVMHVYLPPGLRWANSMGMVADPRVMDWRDVLKRLKAAKPTPTEDALVRTLRSGQRLLLVAPIIRSGSWRAPWTKEVRKRSAQWQRVLDRDKRLLRVLAAPHLDGRRPKGVRLVLYERL
jgi:hypothetical protein